jgi:hypothetical protein
MKPKDFSQYKEGEWDGKVLIRDKREAKSGIVNIKVKAVSGEKMRMDVTSNIGTHVASFLLLGDEVQFLNIQEKSFYKSKASRDSLKRVLKIPIDPRQLYNVFFDISLVDKNWVCENDDRGYVKNCQDKMTGLKIEWISREGLKRTISLEHSNVSIQMSLYDFDSNVSDPENSFHIKPPASFKNRQI